MWKCVFVFVCFTFSSSCHFNCTGTREQWKQQQHHHHHHQRPPAEKPPWTTSSSQVLTRNFVALEKESPFGHWKCPPANRSPVAKERCCVQEKVKTTGFQTATSTRRMKQFVVLLSLQFTESEAVFFVISIVEV